MSSMVPKIFDDKKRKIKILVLGPYRPSDAEKRLTEFRKFLRSKGYKSARLVADFPDKPKYHDDWDVHFTLKSQFLIKHWADALIFVLLKNADNQGVINEFMFTHQNVLEKINLAVILIERGVQLSSLTKGPIKIHKIDTEYFESVEDLYDVALGYCDNFVLQLFWVL